MVIRKRYTANRLSSPSPSSGMKLVFLNPPSINSRYINRDLMGGLGVTNVSNDGVSQRLMSFLKARSIRLPVMSLAYSATIASRDHDVSVVDAANLSLSMEEAIRRIESLKPDWVISTTSISAVMAEAEMVAGLKKRLGCTVGLLGDAATQMAKRVFERSDIDFVVRGDEPELVIKSILERGTYRGLPGTIYRENGTLRDGGDPGYIADLDRLPFPRWDLFPIASYRYFPILRRAPFVTVLSTRGCPYGCVYCPYTSNQGLKYRLRSAGNVVDELTLLKQNYAIRAVQFRDPTFTINKDRTADICRGMVERDLRLEWGCETRVDCLTEELVDTMVGAGLKGVNIGIESTDPDVIRNVKRGWIDPARIERIVRHMHACGVRVSGFFIIGLPGETLEAVKRTLDFALSIELSYAEFKIATPFPGTPLFEMAQTNKWIDTIELEQYTSYTPTMRIPGGPSPEALSEMAKDAYRKFYMRPAKVLGEIADSTFLPNLMKIVLS